MTGARLSFRFLSSKAIDVIGEGVKSYCCESWIPSAAIKPWAVQTSTAIAKDGITASVGCFATVRGGLGLGVPFIDLQLARSVAS